MIKLPKPVMYKTPWGDLVTVDQMHQAIRDALEEAADIVYSWDTPDCGGWTANGMGDAILKLKEQIK